MIDFTTSTLNKGSVMP